MPAKDVSSGGGGHLTPVFIDFIHGYVYICMRGYIRISDTCISDPCSSSARSFST